MHNNEDDKANELPEELAAAEPQSPDEENGILEASEEPIVSEEQLLELAKTEGLIDSSIEEEPAADPEKPLDMSEAQAAEIMASIETVLFMSDKPVSLPKLRQTINSEIPLSAYRTLMARLRGEFAADHRGIEIAEVALGFQLRTKPHMAAVLRRMVKTQPLRLSTATMEVLAVIAYKQPVTKDEVDSIRGVDSGYVLRNLMEKRLVRIAGRSELPGKPMLYGTTHEFLELFNLKDAGGLPPLHEVEAMVAASEVGFEEKTQKVMDEFGKMVASADTILFDDSKIDDELEALRSEIAAIPTSTRFIDHQKAKEKLDAKLAELASRGLTLDAEGNEVPLGSVPADAAYATLAGFEPEPASIEGAAAEAAAEQAIEAAVETAIEPLAEALSETPTITTTTVIADAEVVIQVAHQPSSDLEAAAAAAQWERHAAMIAEAVGEAQVAIVNAETLSDAVAEAKIEQELKELDAEHDREPEAGL